MPNLISNTLALAGGVAAGAVAMYLLDPDQGQSRRGDIAGSAADAVSSTHRAVRTTVAGASDSAHSVANTIGKYAKGLASQMQDAADGTTDAVRGSVSDASDSAHSMASRIAAYAKELAGRVTGHVTDATDTVHDAAGSAVSSARSAHKRAVRQAKARVADAVSSAQSYGRSTYKQAKATQDDWMDRVSSVPDRARSLARRALGVAEPEAHPIAKATGITAGTVGVLVVGAGLMYFLDPQKGRARRALLVDKVTSTARHSGHKARQYGHHLGNKAQGYAVQARDAVPDEWVDKAKAVVGSVTGHADGETPVPSAGATAE